jgi:hypothetical protein
VTVIDFQAWREAKEREAAPQRGDHSARVLPDGTWVNPAAMKRAGLLPQATHVSHLPSIPESLVKAIEELQLSLPAAQIAATLRYAAVLVDPPPSYPVPSYPDGAPYPDGDLPF